MPMSENLYLIGSSGNPNYGDELIVAAWLKFLARNRPEATVWLDCPQPGTASELLAGIHPRFHATDTLWRSCADAPVQSAEGVWEYVGNMVSNGGAPMHGAGFDTLAQADSIHLLGGGYVNGVWPSHVGLVSGMSVAAGQSGSRLIASGVGIMPPPDNAEHLRKTFARFESVTARDDASADFLGLRAGPDDVFLGLPYELARSDRSPLVQSRAQDVMLCIQSDMSDEETFARLTDKLRVVVKESRARGLSIGYVEAIPGSDRRMFDALEGLIPEANFVPFARVWGDGLPVRRGQHWYTTRFHPHMVAASAGAKGVAIGILDDYYDVKHRSLLRLGTGWTYTSANANCELPEPSGSSNFPDAAVRLSNRKQTEALSLYPASN